MGQRSFWVRRSYGLGLDNSNLYKAALPRSDMKNIWSSRQEIAGPSADCKYELSHGWDKSIILRWITPECNTSEIIFSQLYHLCSMRKNVVVTVDRLIKWRHLTGMIRCLDNIPRLLTSDMQLQCWLALIHFLIVIEDLLM